jgi:hypothetical protein
MAVPEVEFGHSCAPRSWDVPHPWHIVSPFFGERPAREGQFNSVIGIGRSQEDAGHGGAMD